MTKKEWARRGNPCSLPECPWQVEWKIFDEQHRLVRQWCSTHKDQFSHGLAEREWTAERVGGANGGANQAVDSVREGSGGFPHADDTGGGEAKDALEPGRPASPNDERRLALSPTPGAGPVRPAGPDRGHPAPALTATAPAAPPSLAYWQGAGELCLTPAQQEILWQPVDENEVQIRPDGIVYLPWAKVWRVILQAFSPQVPALLWLGEPRAEGFVVVLHVAMLMGGKFIGEAYGECKYRQTNKNMSWASCVEGAQSDAVVKISKRLGMFQELWSVPWNANWRREHAMRVYRTQKREWAYRRIDDEPFYDEGDPRKSSPGQGANARTFDDDAREHMDSLHDE